MKILNIIDIPWHSGLAAYAFDQSSALAERGHSIFFAAPENSAAAAFARDRSLPLTIIPPRRSHLIIGALLGLRKLIDSEKIDIINAHTGRAQTMAWLASRLATRKTVLIRTKADAKLPSAGFTMNRAALIIAGSGAIKKMYTRAGLADGKVEVIYQGITPSPPLQSAEALPLKIGILGRLDPVKGHIFFLDAAALVLEKFPSAEFLIAGREENVKYAELKRRTTELGIADKVKFLGHIPDREEFNSSCDVGVVASLGSEAVSRAALEWLAAGKPLVATAVGCLPELVAPEWLVPPRNPAMLAAKLLDLLRSPERRLSAGARNRARIAEDLTPGHFSEFTERAFLRSLARQ